MNRILKIGFRFPGFLEAWYTAVKTSESGPPKIHAQNSYFNPTLYCNPAIYVAGEDNKTVISFYNYGEVKRVKIVVQGYTEDGRILSFEKIVP